MTTHLEKFLSTHCFRCNCDGQNDCMAFSPSNLCSIHDVISNHWRRIFSHCCFIPFTTTRWRWLTSALCSLFWYPILITSGMVPNRVLYIPFIIVCNHSGGTIPEFPLDHQVMAWTQTGLWFYISKLTTSLQFAGAVLFFLHFSNSNILVMQIFYFHT